MIKSIAKKIINYFGFDIVTKKSRNLNVDMEDDFIEIMNLCKPYTRTSIERMYALYKAIEYLVKNDIKGDLVECGVWKGGSAMVMAYALKKFNEYDRKIYLYDTYEGMSVPNKFDKDIFGNEAKKLLDISADDKENSVWCYSSMDEVKNNLKKTGYPIKNLVFVAGKVEDTIPETIPKTISLLRLDTDWYESTYHELVHLYPKVIQRGVIIIDDYGHWEGARKAVNKYISDNNVSILLNRIDYTGRLGIKL